jgi:hypothetical protein
MILSHANANNALNNVKVLSENLVKTSPPPSVLGGGVFLYRLPYLLLDGQVNYTQVLRWLWAG